MPFVERRTSPPAEQCLIRHKGKSARLNRHNAKRPANSRAFSCKAIRDSFLGKQRMGLEIRLKIHLEAKQIGGIVSILFAALVATHGQAKIDLRRRSECVGLAERNFVPAVKILMPVEFLVLADYNPTVRFVLTPTVPCGHCRLLKSPGFGPGP
jgi:hypothetical protein